MLDSAVSFGSVGSDIPFLSRDESIADVQRKESKHGKFLGGT
jgi:hypothetical protein